MVENEKRGKHLMPTLHSHTHYQAAPANAKTQAWQRVCLSNRTTKTTDKSADEKEHRSDNRRLAKKRVHCLNEALFFVSSSLLADSLMLRNPLLRQAPNRCASY